MTAGDSPMAIHEVSILKPPFSLAWITISPSRIRKNAPTRPNITMLASSSGPLWAPYACGRISHIHLTPTATQAEGAGAAEPARGHGAFPAPLLAPERNNPDSRHPLTHLLRLDPCSTPILA